MHFHIWNFVLIICLGFRYQFLEFENLLYQNHFLRFFVALCFNHIKINPAKVVDFWKVFITHKHKSTPSWIWTKTLKKEKEKLENKYKEEIIDFIKEKNEISNREIKELIEFFPSKFKEYYKEVESLLR